MGDFSSALGNMEESKWVVVFDGESDLENRPGTSSTFLRPDTSSSTLRPGTSTSTLRPETSTTFRPDSSATGAGLSILEEPCDTSDLDDLESRPGTGFHKHIGQSSPNRIHYELDWAAYESSQKAVKPKRKSRIRKLQTQPRNDNRWEFPRKDGVDFAIEQARGGAIEWQSKDYEKQEGKRDVSLGIWEFENHSTQSSKFESMTKQQLLHIIGNLPVKLQTLLRDATPPTKQTPKSKIVTLLTRVEEALVRYDEKEALERKQQEENEDDEEEAEQKENIASGDEEFFQNPNESKQADTAPIVPTHLQFRTRKLLQDNDSLLVVTPRQAHLVSKVFFK